MADEPDKYVAQPRADYPLEYVCNIKCGGGERQKKERQQRSLTFRPTVSAAAATTTNARTNANARRRHHQRRFAPREKEVGAQAPQLKR